MKYGFSSDAVFIRDVMNNCHFFGKLWRLLHRHKCHISIFLYKLGILGKVSYSWQFDDRSYADYIIVYKCHSSIFLSNMASSFTRFLDHTQRHTTVSRTPLDKWSAHRRDIYLTTHNTYNRKTSMPPVRFEPTFPAGERPVTHALGRAATGTDINVYIPLCNYWYMQWNDACARLFKSVEFNHNIHTPTH
jgi:hypothetical protein